ncbi:MAG: 1-acyl-sn-glycerol-3-phosphate acyltransferase [Bdellovibrionota bacterium]
MSKPVFARISELLASKLYRSFESSEAFLDEVAEIRKQHVGKKFIFLIFDAGLLELLALRYFFKKRWGDHFKIRRALGYWGIWGTPFPETVKRFFSWFGLYRTQTSKARLAKRELQEKHPLVFKLHLGFRAGRVSSTEKLLEYLMQTEKDLVVIPVVFIWRRVGRKIEVKDVNLSSRLLRTIRTPLLLPWYLLLGDPTKPLGLRKLFMMLRGYSRSIVGVASVIPVTSETTLQGLRRESIRAIQKEKKVVLGPVYKPSRGIWEQILRDPSFLTFIKQHAIEEGVSETKILKRAESNLKEIAADYSHATTEVMGWGLEKVFHTIYQGFTFDKEQFKKIRDKSKEGVLVFIPNHRSYLDFLVLSYFLFREQMVTPHVAAGINLNFWPIGHAFKAGGAFFIRRSFRGDKLYSEMLRRYVIVLMNNHINIEFFIEGMRSRIGKMTPPKYGILKVVIDAFLQKKVTEKIFLVPVSITYDRVTEDKMHKRELEGGTKVQENALNAVQGSVKVLLNRYGRVHLRFAEPQPIEEAISKHMPDSEVPDLSRWLVPRVAFDVCHKINLQTPVTPAGLVSTVLIARPGAAMSQLELERCLLMLEKDVPRLGFTKEPELEMNFLSACMRALSRLIKDGIVQEYKLQDGGTGVRIADDERITAMYYRNAALHAFLLPAIWGMSRRDEQKALELRNLLRFEFFFPGREEFLESLRSIPQDMAVEFYAYLLEDVLENIHACLSCLLQSTDMKLDDRQWSSRLLKYGHERLIEGEIRRRESVNTHSIKAFVEMAKNDEWLSSDGGRDLSVNIKPELGVYRTQIKDFLAGLQNWEDIKSKWMEQK